MSIELEGGIRLHAEASKNVFALHEIGGGDGLEVVFLHCLSHDLGLCRVPHRLVVPAIDNVLLRRYLCRVDLICLELRHIGLESRSTILKAVDSEHVRLNLVHSALVGEELVAGCLEIGDIAL